MKLFQFQITSVKKSPNTNEATITITTDKIAPFVWLETEEKGEFSDNGFILLKPNFNLKFKKNINNETINIEKLKQTLTVRSLI